MPPTYSLVVPIFNEEAVIAVLLKRLDVLLEALDARAEVIVVDDGSRDSSAIVIEAKARADKRYWLTNCRAISAIRSRSLSGSIMPLGAVIVMDSDLQDPPEVVLEMIAKWKEGDDVVSAERVSTSTRKPVQADGRESLLSPHHGLLGDVSHPATPAISTWSIARRSDGRATASGDIELAGGDRSRRWPGGFERMGAGGQPVHARPHCHRAHFALYRREARPDGPVAQRLEPAAHNGLVAGSSPARPTTSSGRPAGAALSARGAGQPVTVERHRADDHPALDNNTARRPRRRAGSGHCPRRRS